MGARVLIIGIWYKRIDMDYPKQGFRLSTFTALHRKSPASSAGLGEEDQRS